MSQWDDQIFKAAKFIAEWNYGGKRWKLYEVPRKEIDEGSRCKPAHLLHGIDLSTNICRWDELLDTAYMRKIDPMSKEFFREELIPSAPPEAAAILKKYSK